MKFTMACGYWINEYDEKVLDVLEKSDRWLSVEELCEITGLPAFRVKRTLTLLVQQIGIARSRKRFSANDFIC